MGIREIKANARRALHQAMRVPASYYASPGSPAEPILIHVRVHTKENKVGDLAGTNLSYAENREEVLKLVFMRDEVSLPARGALVVIALDEGYVVDNLEKPDGLTVTAHVTRADEVDLAGRKTPDQAEIGDAVDSNWQAEEW